MQQQASSAPTSHPNNPPPPPPPPSSNSSLKRSPATTPPSLAPLSSAVHRRDAVGPLPPLAAAHPPPPGAEAALSSAMARVRLSDIAPYDGAPAGPYLRAVEALSGSLTRHNAAVIELGPEDAALMRCGLEAAKLYLRTRSQAPAAGKGSPRGVYLYRAGRPIEDWDSSPPCMGEIFKCMGKVARAALCAIARHLRLRSDVFTHLLDDIPLPANEVSSSVLVASYSPNTLQSGKVTIGGGKLSANVEVEKGLLTLISSDNPGVQVCDPNGRWYLADGGASFGDLLLVTGKALSHVTAGLRPAALHRAAPDYFAGSTGGGMTSLAFRLMPQSNAVLDCSPIAAAGHVIPQSYVPVSVSQFMDDLSAEEDALCPNPENVCVLGNNSNKEPTLRSVLSDPLSGAFLEDAVVVSCGHSFGGFMLKRVIDTSRCTLCSAEIKGNSLIPNHALRAAAAAVKLEDDRRLFHNAHLRKRRKEMGDQADPTRRSHRVISKRAPVIVIQFVYAQPDVSSAEIVEEIKNLFWHHVSFVDVADSIIKENGESGADNGLHKGVQYPFTVNEKVLIKGNKRTPEKFVGKEAIITSQCLNGWYLLKIIENGENVRLQYRSLEKIANSNSIDDRCPSQIQNGSS